MPRRDARACGCSTAAAAPAPTGDAGAIGRAFGFDLTAGLAFGQIKWDAAGGARQHRGDSVSRCGFDIVTSFDVLYGLPDEIEQAGGRRWRAC